MPVKPHINCAGVSRRDFIQLGLGGLLGAGLGYLYNELSNQRIGDVELGAGTDFGVMLNQPVSLRVRSLQ